MMNQPHEFVNKLRHACEAMGKCREADHQAKTRKEIGGEPDEPVRPITTTVPTTSSANLQR
jgi:hypothetical protein